jgi:hypothetical protein
MFELCSIGTAGGPQLVQCIGCVKWHKNCGISRRIRSGKCSASRTRLASGHTARAPHITAFTYVRFVSTKARDRFHRGTANRTRTSYFAAECTSCNKSASAFARVSALGQHQPRAGCRPSQRAKAWASLTANCRSRARSAKRKQPCMPLSHASCLLARSTEQTSCCACPRCGDTTRRSLARRQQPVSLPASWSGATRTAWTRCGCGGVSGGALTSEWGSPCGLGHTKLLSGAHGSAFGGASHATLRRALCAACGARESHVWSRVRVHSRRGRVLSVRRSVWRPSA